MSDFFALISRMRYISRWGLMRSSIPENVQELQEVYAPLISGEVGEDEKKLLKAADRLSAYVKCVEERKAGNLEFLSAEEQTRRRIEDMHLPEADYFLEHFMPAFGKNLDELGTMT